MSVPVNRCEPHWKQMAEQQAATERVKVEKAPPSEFARRFREAIAEKGLNKESLAEAVNARGKITIDPRQIQNFRSSQVASLGSIRNTIELAECAAAMGRTPADFFSTDELPNPTKAHDDMHAMLDVALSGPKSGFLREALQFAFTQAILAKNHL